MRNTGSRRLLLFPALSGFVAVAAATLFLGPGNAKAQAKSIPAKWPTFKSKSYNYTVQYPPDWHRLAEGTSELDLVNYVPEKSDLGILFHLSGHPGATLDEVAAEAELGVNVHPQDVETVEEWMIQDVPEEPIQKDEKIHIAQPAADGCLQLRRISATNYIQGQTFADAYYYCATKAGLFQVLLTYRPGNPQVAELQALALKMVLSLRAP